MRRTIFVLVVLACLSCTSTEDYGKSNIRALHNQSCQAQPTKNVGFLNPDSPVAWCMQSPVYPIEAKKSRIEGYVISEFTVLENGKTTDITILESEPEGVFDVATIQALERSFFIPSGKKYIKVKQKYNFLLPPETSE